MKRKEEIWGEGYTQVGYEDERCGSKGVVEDSRRVDERKDGEREGSKHKFGRYVKTEP